MIYIRLFTNMMMRRTKTRLDSL